jgi:hypothetical protein
MEHSDPVGVVEHVLDHRRVLRVQQIVVRVGSSERDDERDLDAVRQTKRQRACAVGVKGVDQCRPVGLDLGVDCRNGDGREIPQADLDAPLGETLRHPRDRHGIAPRSRWTERREDRQAEGHGREHIGYAALRKDSPANLGSNPSHAAGRLHIMYGNVRA